jgi:multiple sugar transport system permease protein
MIRKGRNPINMLVIYSLLAVLVVFAACPMAWMFSTSIKPRTDIFKMPPQWIPENATFSHYQRIFFPTPEDAITTTSQTAKQFGLYFGNSVLISIVSSVLAVIVAAPAAYAFSRFSFPGKNAAYFGILVRNMFPLLVFLVPIFFLWTTLRLRNTYPGLIIAYLTFSLPLSIWLLKGFYDSIPPELERAARVDGCSRFGAFWRIILPLTTPGLAATAIYSFIQAWNEYAFALHLTDTSVMRTLPVGLTYFFTENTADWPGLMASALFISIPVVVVFLLLQRFFVSAITAGAVKA